MSFKDFGTAFATGFLTQKGKQMTAANEKAEKYYDLQLQLAEQNKGKYKSRVGVANNLVSVANEIRSLYGTEEQIKAAVAQGPKELSNLLNRMKRDKDLKGAGWNEEYVQGVYAKLPANVTNSPEWLKYSEMDTTDYIMETLGVKKYEVGDYKSPDSSFWDKLSGKNKMARTRADLDELEFYEGMSVYDINQSANEADYNALLPGAFLEYTTEKFITPEVRSDFAKDIETTVAIIKKDPEVQGLIASHKELMKKIPGQTVFKSTVLDRTVNSAGKTIVDLSNLRSGQAITFEKHAKDGVSKEEFDAWVENNPTISAYMNQANALGLAQQAIRNKIQPAIENKVNIEIGKYGEGFAKDASVMSTIALYLPDINAVDDTTGDNTGTTTGGDADAAVVVTTGGGADAAVDVTTTLSEQNVKNLRVVNPGNDKLWDYTGPKGKKFRIIMPNSDRPMVIPYFPNSSKLDFKNRKQGSDAILVLDSAGLTGNFNVETITLTEKERMIQENRKIQGYNVDQTVADGPGGGIIAALGEKPTREELVTKKRAEESATALSIATSTKAEDFYISYKGSDIENLSDNEIIRAFSDMYNGKIPSSSGFKSVLAEAIRKNIIAKQNLGAK